MSIRPLRRLRRPTVSANWLHGERLEAQKKPEHLNGRSEREREKEIAAAEAAPSKKRSLELLFERFS